MISQYVMFAIVISVLGLGAILTHYFLSEKKQQNKIRVVLFEQVGNDKVYKGVTTAYIKEDKKLGVYIHLTKERIAISDICNEDYIFDKQLGKCLLVVKYAEDDYRPYKRMQPNHGWFKKVQVQLFEEVENIDKETGESLIDRVPKLDKQGNQLFDEQLVAYDESLGISQTSREAMRFNRKFNARMDELMKEKKSFLERYGSMIAIGMVAMVLMISFIYMTKSHSTTMIKISEDWTEQAEQYNSDNFFGRLTTWATNKEAQENQPAG